MVRIRHYTDTEKSFCILLNMTTPFGKIFELIVDIEMYVNTRILFLKNAGPNIAAE